MGKANVVLDWTMRHGPVMGTINAAGGALAAAAIGDVADVSAWWGFLGSVVGTGATYVAGMARDWGWPRLPFRVGAFAAASGWVTYALATTPWSVNAFASLAVGAVAGGVLSKGVANYRRREAEEQRLAFLASATTKLYAEWEARIARVCHVKGAKVYTDEQWEQGTGFTLDIDLPAGGHTWKAIKSHEEGLAADARLPEGCGVEVSAGANRGSCLIRVSTVNAMIEEHPFPADYSHTTINNPFPIGVYRDGTTAEADLRFICGVTVGQTGSGKTNMVQVQNAQLVRCVDTVVWHIDCAGAGLSLPWIRPFLENRANIPAVDWVASTPAEASAMADAAIAIINTRKAAYQELMRAKDEDKLPVTPAVPQIVIVADEFAELPEALKDKIVSISNTGRAAGVRTMVCGLRGTADTVPVPLKKQAQLRIGMRVTDEEELSYLFGWSKAASPEDAPYEGCGFLAIGQEAARPFKAYRLKPSQIEQIAIAVTDRRPALDAVSAQAAGREYETRWQRVDHSLNPANEATATARSVGGGWGEPTQAPVSDGWEPRMDESIDQTLHRMHQTVAELGKIADQAERERAEAEHDPVLEQKLAAFRDELDAALPSEDNELVPEPLASIVAAFAFDTRGYISTADLATGIGRTGQDAARDLGYELSRPPFELKASYVRRKEYPTGKPVRGYFLANLRQMAERFRREERT